MIIWSLSFIVIIIVIIILSAHKQIASPVRGQSRINELRATDANLFWLPSSVSLSLSFSLPSLARFVSPVHAASIAEMRPMGCSLVALVNTHLAKTMPNLANWHYNKQKRAFRCMLVLTVFRDSYYTTHLEDDLSTVSHQTLIMMKMVMVKMMMMMMGNSLILDFCVKVYWKEKGKTWIFTSD